MKDFSLTDLLLLIVVIQMFGVIIRLSTLIRTTRGVDQLSKNT
jgi:hypothetical protein